MTHRIGGQRGTWFTRPELRALLTAARAHSIRDHAIILTGYWHGLRASELADLRVGDIRDGSIFCNRLKGSERNCQALVNSDDPLMSERTVIEALCAGKPSSAHVFTSEHGAGVSRWAVWDIVRKHGRTAGLPELKIHPHSLKHSLARHLLETAPLTVVQKRLGHIEIENTREYLKATDADADAAVTQGLAMAALV